MPGKEEWKRITAKEWHDQKMFCPYVPSKCRDCPTSLTLIPVMFTAHLFFSLFLQRTSLDWCIQNITLTHNVPRPFISLCQRHFDFILPRNLVSFGWKGLCVIRFLNPLNSLLTLCFALMVFRPACSLGLKSARRSQLLTAIPPVARSVQRTC